jgi:hypothetical protein
VCPWGKPPDAGIAGLVVACVRRRLSKNNVSVLLTELGRDRRTQIAVYGATRARHFHTISQGMPLAEGRLSGHSDGTYGPTAT